MVSNSSESLNAYPWADSALCSKVVLFRINSSIISLARQDWNVKYIKRNRVLLYYAGQ
jgi:hypothetical protein